MIVYLIVIPACAAMTVSLLHKKTPSKMPGVEGCLVCLRTSQNYCEITWLWAFPLDGRPTATRLEPNRSR